MADKSYKSYRQQLNILRSRGMVIGKGSQGSRVMRILERENYYNVHFSIYSQSTSLQHLSPVTIKVGAFHRSIFFKSSIVF